MDTRLHALAGQQDGAFSVHEAMQLGVGDTELRRAVREGELIRVRRGAYVMGARWSSADLDERFRLKAMAVARTRKPDALSHHAALAQHGLPLWEHDPERIDLIGDVRQGVNRDGVWLHPRADAQITDIGGVPVVPIARAVVRTALTMGLASAVVAGDAALHAERVSLDDLLRQVALLSAHEGRGRALEAVHRMDSAAESVGESRTRMILQELGLSYESQVVLRDAPGSSWHESTSSSRASSLSSTAESSTSATVIGRTVILRPWGPLTWSGWRSVERTGSGGWGTRWNESSGASWRGPGRWAPASGRAARTHRVIDNAPVSEPGELSITRCVRDW